MEQLQRSTFADVNSDGELMPFKWEFGIQMMHSDWTAKPLLLLNNFWADLIRFAPGKGVGTHTHPWDHILLVMVWTGRVEYNWVDYELKPWVAYMVPGSVPHAIKAKDELVLMSIANEHRPAWSQERLDVVEK